MALIDTRNITSIHQMSKWTGISPKTLSSWARRGKFKPIDASVTTPELFDWSTARPAIIKQIERTERSTKETEVQIPIENWPHPK